MKILVINCGSSSIKYKLFDMGDNRLMASGQAERIGESRSILTHRRAADTGEVTHIENDRITDHHQGLKRLVELLFHPYMGAISSQSDIGAVGHRIVHGGNTFREPTLIDDEVITEIEACIPLAPLHNPANLMGVQLAMKLFPEAAQVAVFDTAFHQTLPAKAYLYAIPLELHQEYKIRRYGFHGTSHAFVAHKAAEYLKKPLRDVNLITLHLGNGASMAAIAGGQSVDTTMGLTPLAGLVMGTRSGDIDPSVLLYLARHANLSVAELEELLNKKSGLKGLCGMNDMREIIAKAGIGDQPAKAALAIFTYRIKKYIGAYMACLGRVNALVFTAGIGENSPLVRELCCQGLQGLGVAIDDELNWRHENGIREISTTDSCTNVLVVPTNEELRIAQETKWAVQKSS